jgi:hypothetical protein
VLQQTKHTDLERQCDCGHWTHAEPGRCAEEADWTVALTEWHLAGPTLVRFIVALTQRMRLSHSGAGVPARPARTKAVDGDHQPMYTQLMPVFRRSHCPIMAKFSVSSDCN